MVVARLAAQTAGLPYLSTQQPEGQSPTLYCQEARTISLAARSFARRTGSATFAPLLLLSSSVCGPERERPATC